MQVDAVITWVDGSDPVWRKKRARYLPPKNAVATANVEGRYRDNGELRYLLRSLDKYWPFKGNIYLVTDNQVPDFIVPGSGITVVDHRDILDEDFLPTFSSLAIESAIHKIPGLPEHFVYFNDDVFLSRPVGFSDFFGEMGPITYLTNERIPEYSGKDSLSGHQVSCRGRAWIRDNFNVDGLGRILSHYPNGIMKSKIKEMEERFPEIFFNTRRNKFRSGDSYSIITNLYHEYCHAQGLSVVEEDKSLYLFSDQIEDGSAWPVLREAIGNKLSICIQDTADNRTDLDVYHQNLHDYCTALYPEPSRWEIP